MLSTHSCKSSDHWAGRMYHDDNACDSHYIVAKHHGKQYCAASRWSFESSCLSGIPACKEDQHPEVLVLLCVPNCWGHNWVCFGKSGMPICCLDLLPRFAWLSSSRSVMLQIWHIKDLLYLRTWRMVALRILSDRMRTLLLAEVTKPSLGISGQANLQLLCGIAKGSFASSLSVSFWG